jgi:hypothetical protein
MVVFDGVPGKEPWSLFLLASMFILTVRMVERPSLRVFWPVLPLAGLAWFVRWEVLLIGVAGGMAFSMAALWQRGGRSRGRVVWMLVLGAMGFVGVAQVGFEDRVTQAQIINEQTASLDSHRQLVRDALTPGSMVDLLLFVPIKTLIYLFAPFPKMWVEFDAFERITFENPAGHAEFIRLSSALTGLVMLLVISRILAMAASRVVRIRALPLAFPLGIAALVLFAGIANISLLPHLRYRVMVMPVLFAFFVATLQGRAPTQWVWYGGFMTVAFAVFLASVLS